MLLANLSMSFQEPLIIHQQKPVQYLGQSDINQVPTRQHSFHTTITLRRDYVVPRSEPESVATESLPAYEPREIQSHLLICAPWQQECTSRHSRKTLITEFGVPTTGPTIVQQDAHVRNLHKTLEIRFLATELYPKNDKDLQKLGA